ncbi:MarR family transcriptional regulator [Halalkalibacterium halodurans]|uniref:Transcriptional regulator (MarR family) n=1 Tax=Halalkalibacterium halodurans (strain ATCC BAA-125 / DSM 18197 / FERM 7344 / JCM 9153 / C-125) TaxID=272558 RepID=Q9K5P4_HALH5|nr:MarR family transcriptional regulator [Halalkalibacterium halodurans]MED4081052.1 MarR family transcriptional regulator [Halalkalibacterium halodurans]MED4084884.1 MarR family transcriptional regulator [Halalkalibacterium halodurans]MED4103476.1 MarR family transcriptional regulator [Halalkalibacterium halodurans]MED4107748.1 MarR family transcriptional regulator [Halalkalibacterium halodurans]MED4126498.1 MarR family transcriptional regulator [Halalkalibacterium halodurans]
MTNHHSAKSPAIDVIHALIKTSHYIQREFDAQLTNHDMPFQLSGPRLRVLLAVSEEGEIRMSELASKLGVKARTVTDFVDALEKDQLLVRLPDPKDRRATLIQLTEMAQVQIQKVHCLQEEAAEALLTNLSEEQRNELIELLGNLANYQNVPCSFEE